MFIILIIFFNNKFTTLSKDVKKLMKNGYLIIPNVVSHKDCDKILKIIHNTKNKKYGSVHSDVNRKDMMLSTNKLSPFIKNIYKKTKHI